MPPPHPARLMRRWIVFVIPALILLPVLWVAAAASEPRIVVLGDSLTAGYRLPSDDAFPARLEEALREAGYDWRVINAGVSGDTSAGGLARLDWVLEEKPEIVIIELGANDGLRGLPVDQLSANLDQILTRVRAFGTTALLTGMLAPPNYGTDYSDAFRAVYLELAERHAVAFYPFFLEGVATVPALNQGDGIHPTAAGVDEIVRRILPDVVSLITEHKGG